jgi:hypothetical protein
MPQLGVTVGTTTEPTERVITGTPVPVYSIRTTSGKKVFTSWYRARYTAKKYLIEEIKTIGEYHGLKNTLATMTKQQRHHCYDLWYRAGRFSEGSMQFLFQGGVTA